MISSAECTWNPLACRRIPRQIRSFKLSLVGGNYMRTSMLLYYFAITILSSCIAQTPVLNENNQSVQAKVIDRLKQENVTEQFNLDQTVWHQNSSSDQEKRNITRIGCEICDKKYGYLHNLIGHRVKHAGKKFMRYVQPGIQISRKSASSHEEYSYGQKEFKSDECNKMFKRNCSLKKHKTMKHNEKFSQQIYGATSREITGMSTSLIKSAQPTLEKLELLLTEINELDLSPVDQQLTQEEMRHLYEVRRRTIEEKLERIEQYVSILEIINNNWLDYIQKTTNAARKKEEEEIYIEMADQEKGILRLLSQGRGVKTTLKLYNKDLEIAIRSLTSGHISQGDLKEVSAIGPQVTVHLPQLQLPTFSGDPKTWRQFWNSFDVAMHFQAIPDRRSSISCQRLRYCPQNYDIIRRILIEKFGEDSIIKKSLYAELQSIKRSNRDWKATIEAIERILRQLEAIGENLDHCSIETSIESKLPIWILHKVYEQKKRGSWSITRLRQILGELLQINEEVARNQSFSNKKKSIDFKQKRAPYNNKEETSALSTIKQFKSTKSSGHESATQPKKIARDKRPCAFCNKDHWDNECSAYPTLKQRMEYLRKNNACLNCLRMGHATNNCNKRNAHVSIARILTTLRCFM
ncbi:Pao retrotransposon peptidase family protein [Dirofilaria immitis]|nr:Pao retrotransposon peptidase family protein [Dirofilaria immitis]